MAEWIDLRNPETGGTTRIPDDESVAVWYEARGWERYEPDHPAAFVPDPDQPPPSGVPGDTAGFVDLVHPDLPDGRHAVPNNAEALAGAALAGWVTPNKDGSTPKPATARRRAREATAAVPDVELDSTTDTGSATADTDEHDRAADTPGADTKEG